MKTKHYFFLSAAMLGLTWGWVYNISGQTTKAPAMNASVSPLKEAGLANVDLRGALSYSENWDDTPFPYGFYSVPTVSGTYPEFVFLTDDRNMEGGAVYVDGVIHAISRVGEWFWDDDEEEWDFSQRGAAFTTFDAATGEVLYDTTEVSSDLFSSDLCYDKTTDTIYGVFIVDDYDYAWGILDIDNLEITYINDEFPSSVSALDIDAYGQAYAVTEDGKLVKIDKETGEITDVLADYEDDYDLIKDYKSTGVIDPDTNIFYLLLSSYSAPGVYAIDLDSYELTKLCSLRNMERWGGAYIAKEEVEEGTPAAATNLVLSFPEASLEGTLTFVAPTQTADDDELSGETLLYVVKADDETMAEGTAFPGETVTTDAFTVTPGKHIISVALSNEKGTGLSASTSFWFGSDSPAGVENLSASNDGYTVSLSWDAPSRSVHGGYFNPSDVTYTVTRMPDNVVVAENIKETSVTDVIESKKVAKYHYTVLPACGGLEGNLTESLGLILGEGVNLPYETDFSDKGDCELMTVEDANHDGNTWEIGEGKAIYRFGDVEADDWFFSVPFYFEAGTRYHLDAVMKSGLERREKFEIKIGRAQKSEDMLTTILDPTEFEAANYYVEEDFSVPEDGTYFIGYHALSPSDHFTLWVLSMSVEVGMSEGAPGAAELTAKAGEKGALSATLEIVAPTKNVGGNDISSLEGAYIFKGEELIDTMEDVEPGETYTYVCEDCDRGVNTFSVTFVNEYGNGVNVVADVFVGKDIPLAPKNVHFEMEGNVAHLTWEFPGEVGANGGYVDEDGIKYAPFYYDYESGWTDMGETTKTELEVNYDVTGPQRWLIFGVIAYNDMGQCEDAAYSNYKIYGDAYEMPFEEGLDGGHNDTFLGSGNPFGGVGSFTSDSFMSATETGGCLLFTPYWWVGEAPWFETFTTGVINTSGRSTVTATFYYYNDATENNGDSLDVYFYDQDNDIRYDLGKVTFDDTATEWRKFEATAEINSDNLRLHIGMTTGGVIYLDEFKVDATATGISSIQNDDIAVVGGENEISISGLDGENVVVTTLNGIVVYRKVSYGEISLAADNGIYMVRVANRTYKVVVK